MSVRPVDMVMLQQINEVTNIKQNETAKPTIQQIDISANVEKKVETKAEQVTEKSDLDNKGRKFDAKDKSDNEYHGQQKKHSKNKPDGHVTLKNKTDFNFDIKV